MARSRNIKPGFYKNEFLAQITPYARLLFIGLWLLADRRGRLEDRPLRIKGELFPFESIEVETLLQELANSPGKFITRYEIENKPFIQIENFHKHQNPHHREAESAIPPCISEKPRASLGLNPTQVVPSLGNSGSSRADSLLLIPDSLTPESGAKASECVSVLDELKISDENQKLGKEGMHYLISLNHPNFSNPQWIAGYLSIQFQELEQSQPDIPKPEILRMWRDTCDLATEKNKPAPQWSKSTFKNKLDAWTPNSSKTFLPEPASDRSLAQKTKELMEFSIIRHIVTEQIFNIGDLEIRPESPNGLTDRKGNYYPVAHLEGLMEVPVNA